TWEAAQSAVTRRVLCDAGESQRSGSRGLAVKRTVVCQSQSDIFKRGHCVEGFSHDHRAGDRRGEYSRRAVEHVDLRDVVAVLLAIGNGIHPESAFVSGHQCQTEKLGHRIAAAKAVGDWPV